MRNLLLATILAIPLFGKSITISNGWNLVGTERDIDLERTFTEHSGISLIWTYDNQVQDWVVFGNSQIIKDKILEDDLSKMENIEADKGFWVLNLGDETEVTIVEFVEKNTTEIVENGSQFLNLERVFTRTGNSVQSSTFGLIWEDQSSIFKGGFSEAKNYCENLELDGISDWRLPTNKELWYLGDREKSSPAISEIFQNTENSYYWSDQAVTYSGHESENWAIHFSTSSDAWQYRISSNYARCVSGESKYEDIEFERDDSKNIVLDKTNNLIWQDGDLPSSKNLSSAKSYCEDLNFGDSSDWRLPTIEELYSITDQKKDRSPFVSDQFQNTENSFHRSITKYNINPSNSWMVNFLGGSDYNYDQSYSDYVRCVSR